MPGVGWFLVCGCIAVAAAVVCAVGLVELLSRALECYARPRWRVRDWKEGAHEDD
jgi:hypothetical protein